MTLSTQRLEELKRACPCIVACPACGGEGMWEVLTGGYDPRDGSPNGYTQLCETCGGSGEVEEEPELRTLQDLQEEDDGL